LCVEGLNDSFFLVFVISLVVSSLFVCDVILLLFVFVLTL
jgi:hypothetical protein